MKLQGRYLKLEMCGEDVALLHQELQKLGFAIPEPELIQNCFGEGSFAAVKDFQTKNEIKATGVVDAQTATAINQAVDALEQNVVVGNVTLKQHGSAYTEGVMKGYDKDLRRKKSAESNSVRSAIFIALGQKIIENSVGVACCNWSVVQLDPV